MNTVTKEALAVEFTKVLREWLSPEQMNEAIEENRIRRSQGDDRTCATHDYCDANMAMSEAAERLKLPQWTEYSDGDPIRDAQMDLENEAWSFAKSKDFFQSISTEVLTKMFSDTVAKA
jgi:hypothetical protein